MLVFEPWSGSGLGWDKPHPRKKHTQMRPLKKPANPRLRLACPLHVPTYFGAGGDTKEKGGLISRLMANARDLGAWTKEDNLQEK